MSARTPTIETQRWGLFTEMERKADVDALRARFATNCIYYRTGGTANWKWRHIAATPTQTRLDEIERMGYPAIPGRTADGPPTKYAVDGWDDIRMRRTHKD